MWNGTYFDWLEEGRINALSKAGINYIDLTKNGFELPLICLLYTSPSPRDRTRSRMPSSA